MGERLSVYRIDWPNGESEWVVAADADQALEVLRKHAGVEAVDLEGAKVVREDHRKSFKTEDGQGIKFYSYLFDNHRPHHICSSEE